MADFPSSSAATIGRLRTRSLFPCTSKWPWEPALPPAVPWLGRVADLPQVLSERQVGQVILLELPATDAEARAVIDICHEQGCRLLIHNNLAERYTQPLVPTIEEGRHFYTLQEEPLEDPLNRVVKRAYDLAIALPVVVLLLPPLCAVSPYPTNVPLNVSGQTGAPSDPAG